MNINIIDEKQNPLFNRKEISAIVKENIIPSKIELAKELSEKYSVPTNAIRILDIKGKFGVKEFKLRANIYPSNEERDKIERLTKKEKEAEKPKEVPKEEAPVEAPKETPAEEAIGLNPVEEAKKVEEKKEDKKEKEKSKEEKLKE